MDAFAVSICKGLSMKKMNWKNAIIIGTYFGVFQAGMPILGFILGKSFEQKITMMENLGSIYIIRIYRCKDDKRSYFRKRRERK